MTTTTKYERMKQNNPKTEFELWLTIFTKVVESQPDPEIAGRVADKAIEEFRKRFAPEQLPKLDLGF